MYWTIMIITIIAAIGLLAGVFFYDELKHLPPPLEEEDDDHGTS